MQLNLERPDYAYFLRGADGTSALVNERRLHTSFVIAPDTLIEDWPARDARMLAPSDFEVILSLAPELVILGTGAIQVFPPQAVLATCLQRGIGIEVMSNAAAARTYAVLAGEGRRVAAGFLLG
ncbi:Mth938-like domain-containing protein [Thermomonas alba]|uniref:Mth938-like domain-containing protein n=1 Tax=Thermomonas alba TaxID=2888525 RepID=UPI001F04CDA5|nr:Mth938-like domain-containing protein [Thermomonas alba]